MNLIRGRYSNLLSMKKRFLLFYFIFCYDLFWLSEHFFFGKKGSVFLKHKRSEINKKIIHLILSCDPLDYTTSEVQISETLKLYSLMRRRIPFVIRGGARQMKLFKTWDFEYFLNKFGHVQQPTFTNSVEPSKVRKIKLREIITEIKNGNKDVNLLFGNLIYYQKELQAFMNDFFFKSNIRYKRGLLKTDHFFMSAKGTFTNTHAELGDNFFIQVRGKKKWRIYEPALSPIFMPQIEKRFYLNADLKYADLTKTGLLKLPHYEVTLEEGDVLYNPSLHWHYVETLEDSISISSRWSNPFNVLRHPFLFLILSTATDPSVIYQLMNPDNTNPKDL